MCGQKRDSCLATAITITSTKVIYKQNEEHNHSNRLVERQVKLVEKENIAAAALLPTAAPGAISVAVENKMPGSAAFISNRHNINQAIYKKRKSLKGYPSQAEAFEDLHNIPEQFATTADKKRFLLLNDTVIPNNPVPSAPRLLVFMWHFTHYSNG
jgi:hypothetical protein